MLIHCYNTNSDMNSVNKNLTLVKTISATIKDSSDIMRPSLTINNPPDVSFNYVQIVDAPYNGRYYFVLPETTNFHGIATIELYEDVLMSWKSQFLQENAVIERQENEGNLYLIDGAFPSENRNKIFFKEFPNGFDTGLSYYLTIGG